MVLLYSFARFFGARLTVLDRAIATDRSVRLSQDIDTRLTPNTIKRCFYSLDAKFCSRLFRDSSRKSGLFRESLLTKAKISFVLFTIGSRIRVSIVAEIDDLECRASNDVARQTVPTSP